MKVRQGKRWFAGVVAFLLLCVTAVSAEDTASLADRVIIVANRNDDESLRLARHYQEARGIPGENVIALPMPRGETITWDQFWSEVYNPLQSQLLGDRWIEGFASRRVDDLGRNAHQVFGHRIAYLVICRGVPLRISHDPDRMTDEEVSHLPEPQRTNRAAVDQVLALMAAGPFPINGFIPNPLFAESNTPPAMRERVIKVSRLDGPTLRTAQAMVDAAILAERQGLMGRAYIDLTGGPPHPVGDEWLGQAAELLERHHFPVSRDEARAVFGSLARFDAPAFYFGWYAPHMEGPFTLSGFRFPPGAIGFHIHSFSARTLRSRDRQWAGPLIARGITATVGNVSEPFLGLTHRPDILLHALLEEGMSFGDAAWVSLPTLAWQSIALGDPLYRPMTVSLARQLENPPEGAFRNLHPYAIIREMNRLMSLGQEAAARRLGEEAFALHPSLALAEHLARVQQREAALTTMAFLRYTSFVGDRELGLALEMADFLLAAGEGEAGLNLYQRLGGRSDLPVALRRDILERGAEQARANGHAEEAARLEGFLRNVAE